MNKRLTRLVADGFYREAIALYSQLHSTSKPPNHFTFPALLKACAKLNSPLQGQILHPHLIKTGFYSSIYANTALMHMYMKLNLFPDALQVFDQMPHRNLPFLNVVVSGFAQHGHCEKALLVFKEMIFSGFRPNSVTIASVLCACDSFERCAQMHCWALKLGVDEDVYVATSFLTIYFSCAEVVLSKRVFEELPNKSVVSYNAYVSGLLRNGLPFVVLNVFQDMMGCSNEKPNSVTFASVLSACGRVLDHQLGRQVHGIIVKTDRCFDTIVGTALIDMYCKCGRWQVACDVFSELNGSRTLITWNSLIAGMMLNNRSTEAVELFELLQAEGLEPDSATWNSMISGFAHLEMGVEAIEFFKKMQQSGVVPSLKSVTSLLQACASLSSLRYGKEIHSHAIRTDMNTDLFMATALIDLFMKCGCSSLARNVFDQFEIKPKDPAFWNAMISGYGKNGEYEAAITVFHQMLEKNVVPNSSTFTAVLSVCSHTGEISKASEVFRMMRRDYGSSVKPEHLGCLVDLLGRSGRLNDARELIQDISVTPTSWLFSLLGACRQYSHPELGEEVAMKLSQLEPENPLPFVTLSNIYADVGRWEDVERMRQMIDIRGLQKLPGHSLAGVT